MSTRSKPGVLLDRDGTIVEDYHYVGRIERVQFIPGAIDAIRRFNQAGIPVAIVTNQGGVARGFYTLHEVYAVNRYINQELARHGAHVDAFYFSPHHPEGSDPEFARESYDHKPNPGMALAAIRDLHLEQHDSWVVGDRITDVEMARRCGMRCAYLGAEPPPALHPVVPHFHSLAEAATHIIERITGVSTSEFPINNYSGILSYLLHYSDEVTLSLSRVDKKLVEHAADILYKAYSDGSYVFAAGNGGAAAIADHMATDHAKHMAAVDTLYRNVHSLCANHALTTALANDIGYNGIFSWQLEQFGHKDDVLVVFSVSGESRNIIAALQRAREMGMQSIAITGEGGVTIDQAGLATVHITIPNTNYGVCEDIMSILQHALAQYVRQTQMTDHQIASARF
jgi:D-sedoheptulose 7-phosphate isomerase/D-glycero-D-manno-heptose 1,7-bisphosphate phosphatase